ncbi:hypothetical protein EV363DRAFT_269919 [Boletus edulis]|nr:hypothetical protein EV363DRAFT_269919 [Boletus edulis]
MHHVHESLINITSAWMGSPIGMDGVFGTLPCHRAMAWTGGVRYLIGIAILWLAGTFHSHTFLLPYLSMSNSWVRRLMSMGGFEQAG